jgi:hypothetical protein
MNVQAGSITQCSLFNSIQYLMINFGYPHALYTSERRRHTSTTGPKFNRAALLAKALADLVSTIQNCQISGVENFVE